MSDELYRQCKLTKGKSYHVAWIPASKAVQGNFVKLKIDGIWDDGYFVEERYEGTMTHTALTAKEKADKKFGPSIRGD